MILINLFSLLFFIEDSKCTLDLNVANYLLPMQSSISLNVAVPRTDVELLDVTVAKWSFNAPVSAAVMMQKMMEALIFREFKIYDATAATFLSRSPQICDVK